MKILAVLIILSAFGLFGSAFLGIYTAPGLEDLPTLESLEGKKKKEAEADTEKPAKPSGIFPVDSNGKVNERNNYLKSKQKDVAPGT